MAVPNRSAQPVVPSSRPHARPARDKSSRRGGRGMGLFTERIAAPRHRRRRRVERKGGGAGDGEGESRGRSDGGSEDIRDGAVEGQQGMERARRTFVVFTRPDTGRELFADTETPFHSTPGGANNHRSLPFPLQFGQPQEAELHLRVVVLQPQEAPGLPQGDQGVRLVGDVGLFPGPRWNPGLASVS